MADAEPPTIIIPSRRCWWWWARRVHPPHIVGTIPNVKRCPGWKPDEASSAEQLTGQG